MKAIRPDTLAPAIGRTLLALLLGGTPALAQTQTQTAFGCTTSSYLFQGNTTVAYLLDFAAGTTTAQGTNNGNNGVIYPGGVLNAVGYNKKDGYIWSQLNNSTKLVRVGTEFVGKTYDFTQPTGLSQTTFTVGDVDPNGIMYMTRGGSAEGVSNPNTVVYTIDLNQTTTPLAVNALTVPSRTFLTDWAISPIDTCLYAINTYFVGSNYQYNENNTKIYRFVTHDRTFKGVRTLKGTRQTLGVATGGSTPISPANFAAAFMDNNGSFYVVSSNTGQIHRLDRPDQLPAVADASATGTAIPATYVGTFTSGLGNNVDGVRCAYSVPTSGAQTQPTPLPVQLTAFAATAAPNRHAQLTWTTATELNSAYFEVQHSLDGRTFEALGRVAARGSSAQASAYAYLAATTGSAATHYYRLRQVDLDGSSTFSAVRVVTLAAGSSAAQLSVYPNPTAALHAQVQYAGSAAAGATLTLRDLLGRPVLTQPVTLQPGTNDLTPGATLAPGTYWLSLTGEAVAGTPGVRVVVTQ